MRSAARRRGVALENGLNLDALQPGDDAHRGGLESIWKKASILTLDADDLIADAKRKAVELAAEWLGEKVTEWVLEWAELDWRGPLCGRWNPACCRLRGSTGG